MRRPVSFGCLHVWKAARRGDDRPRCKQIQLARILNFRAFLEGVSSFHPRSPFSSLFRVRRLRYTICRGLSTPRLGFFCEDGGCDGGELVADEGIDDGGIVGHAFSFFSDSYISCEIRTNSSATSSPRRLALATRPWARWQDRHARLTGFPWPHKFHVAYS